MKKTLFLFALIVTFYQKTNAQTKISANEQKLTDTICNCLTKVDLSKITSKKDAIGVFTDCFTKRTDLLMQLANEKHIDPTDRSAMRQIGIDIGKDLLSQNCVAFTNISVKMAQKESEQAGEEISEGEFKRIDVRGFNYIVLSDSTSREKSFIWLRQFPGSEKFMNGGTAYIGKNVKIKYQELEVYLPQARGYYKVKEIVSLNVE